jgi:hypothetical protein
LSSNSEVVHGGSHRAFHSDRTASACSSSSAKPRVNRQQKRRDDEALSLADWKETAEILSLKLLVAADDETLVRREVEAGEVALRRARELALARLLRLVRLSQIQERSTFLTQTMTSPALLKLQAASARAVASAISLQLGAAPADKFEADWHRYQAVAREVALSHAQEPGVAEHLLQMGTVRRIAGGIQ